jgi:hypothetical protein
MPDPPGACVLAQLDTVLYSAALARGGENLLDFCAIDGCLIDGNFP